MSEHGRGLGQADHALCGMQVGMDVEAVRAHFAQAQGPHAQRQSALAIRTRSGVAVNIWRTYGAGRTPATRLAGAWPGAWAAIFDHGCESDLALILRMTADVANGAAAPCGCLAFFFVEQGSMGGLQGSSLFPALRVHLASSFPLQVQAWLACDNTQVLRVGVAEPDREEIERMYGKPVEPLAVLQGKVGCTAATMQECAG